MRCSVFHSPARPLCPKGKDWDKAGGCQLESCRAPTFQAVEYWKSLRTDKGAKCSRSHVELRNRKSKVCPSSSGSTKRSISMQLTLLRQLLERSGLLWQRWSQKSVYLSASACVPRSKVTWGTSPEDVVAITGTVPDPKEELAPCTYSIFSPKSMQPNVEAKDETKRSCQLSVGRGALLSCIELPAL